MWELEGKEKEEKPAPSSFRIPATPVTQEGWREKRVISPHLSPPVIERPSGPPVTSQQNNPAREQISPIDLQLEESIKKNITAVSNHRH